MTTNNTAAMTQDGALDKKTIKNCFWRWTFLGELGWNYERMQGLGYCFCMMPALKKIYKDDEDALEAAVANHLQFFNTNMYTGNIILGANLAIELSLKSEGEEVVSGLKTGLMGPLAGVGDSVLGVIPNTIMGSIAAYMALQGNPLGCMLWIALGAVFMGLRWAFFQIGYRQGEHAVQTIAQHMKPITKAASILGLAVVGALVYSTISVHAPGTFVFGEMNQPIQELLDSIMPGLLSFLTAAGVYWLLGRKGMTSNKVILIVFVIGLVFGCSGLLAK